MEQHIRDLIVASLTQQRRSLELTYQRDAPVQLTRDTLLGLIDLVVDLEKRQRPG